MGDRQATSWKRVIAFWSFILIAAYIVYVYPLAAISRWSGYPQWSSWPLQLGLWAFIGVGFWLWFRCGSRVLKYILVHWMGVGCIFFSVCALYELIRLLIPINDRHGVIGVVVSGIGLSLFSLLNARYPVIKRLDIASSKLTRTVRLVQLSDVHIGSRSAAYLAHVVQQVNRLDPEVVVITGDLIDSEKVGPAELSALRKIRVPVFMSIGNHERYVGVSRLLPMLASVGVTVLRQRGEMVGEIQLVGIDDAESENQIAQQLPAIERDQAKFNVLLYHRPLGWPDALNSDIDLMLSGHTHNGQIFPFNWLVRQQFAHIRGHYLAPDNAHHLYVSTGTGTWGPLMRLGSSSEITVFELTAVHDG